MNKNRHATEFLLTSADTHAVATLRLPGVAGGVSVSRAGTDETAAIAATLRAVADTVDASRRQRRRAERGTSWIRMHVLVDVEVPAAELDRARALEERAMAGSMPAAEESMGLSMGWLATAIHDHDAREWHAFDWSPAEDSPDVGVA